MCANRLDDALLRASHRIPVITKASGIESCKFINQIERDLPKCIHTVAGNLPQFVMKILQALFASPPQSMRMLMASLSRV